MRALLRGTFAVTMLIAGLSAQTQSTISPKDGEAFGNVIALSAIGSGNTLIPYSYFPVRFQEIFDFDSFTNPKVVVVRSIRYRMAALFANGRQGGQTTRVKIRMAFAAGGVSARTPSNLFAGNLDKASLKTVVNNRTIRLPKLADTSFGFKIPFDAGAAFVWPGAAGKKHLVLEVFQYQNSNQNRPFGYQLDGWSSNAARIGSWAPNGSYAGCPATNGRTVTHQPSSATLVVGNRSHAFTGRGQAPNLPGVVILGARAIDVTLPGTKCKLVNDLLAFFPAISQGTNGSTRVPFPLANDPKLGGLVFRTQMAWLQASANVIGITTSRGLTQRVGLGVPGPVRTSTVAWWTNQSGNPDTFTTGRVSRGFGLITRLTN